MDSIVVSRVELRVQVADASILCGRRSCTCLLPARWSVTGRELLVGGVRLDRYDVQHTRDQQVYSTPRFVCLKAIFACQLSTSHRQNTCIALTSHIAIAVWYTSKRVSDASAYYTIISILHTANCQTTAESVQHAKRIASLTRATTAQ